MLMLSEIEKIDSENMCKVYDEWPNVAEGSFKEELPMLEIKNIDHVVFAGMGGSGTIGDIMSSIFSRANIHVSVIKGYLLPKTVDKNTLVVTTSVSGNTQETLNILKSSKTSEAKFVAFSSGGKIKEFSIKNNIDFFQVDKIHSPRASLTRYLYTCLNIFQDFLPIKRNDIFESISMLKKTKEQISSYKLNEKNPSLKLANWIKGIPVIYYPWGLESAAIRFKNSLQENAKNHVIAENVIEACHNGVVPWQRSCNTRPIFIRGRDDHTKTVKRWNILKEFFKDNDLEYYELFSVQGNILSKIINLIYQLDYSSIYLALINQIDPTPVNAINFIKNKM